MPAPTPDDLRKSVVRMLTFGQDIPMIMAVTDLSETTIREIKQHWEETGSYRRPKTHGVAGRPRLLEVGDVWVSLATKSVAGANG
jgi:transposase